MNAIPTTVNLTNVKASSFFNEKVQTNTDHTTAAHDCSLLHHGDDDLLLGTSNNASSKTTTGAIAATTLPTITTGAATTAQKLYKTPPLSPLVVPKSSKNFVDLTITTTDNHEDQYHGTSPSASTSRASPHPLWPVPSPGRRQRTRPHSGYRC